MSIKKHHLMSAFIAIALAFGSFFSAGAVARTVYVSTTGSDSNAGTSAAPFRTFNKAFSVLVAGDTLQIYGGTYTQQLNVSKSGTSSTPITIQAVSGQTVILDGGNVRDAPVLVPSGTTYVNLSGLTCRRGATTCVLVQGSNVTVSNFEVYEAIKFGVRVTGQNVTIENSSIHDNVLENLNGVNTAGGWGSALRSVQGKSNVIFRNNEVFHNWGEGIIMGSFSSKVIGNKVHDNFSKNIYIGNTYNVDVYQNITYSTESNWFRSGNPADCISMSEEEISSTYGARLGNIRVFNNITYNCKVGIGYTYTEVSGNGCDNCLIAFNTITNSRNACMKVIAGSKNHIEITDNICTTGSITVPSGDITVHHNFSGNASLTGSSFSDPNSYRPLSNSPVVGAGVNAGIGTDYFNVSRTRYDIGAIQAGSTSGSTNPTATTAPISGGSSLNIRVSAGADDVEQTSSGTMKLASSTLQLVYDGNDQIDGLRFRNVNIPRNATITDAYVQFKVQQATSNSTSLTIRGQLSPNAPAFTTSTNNLSSRTRTAGLVSWAPSGWSSVGSLQRTPNISGIVQEIVNQSNWASGNALVIIINGSGQRVAKAYEAEAAGAPLLHVEYTTSSAAGSLSVDEFSTPQAVDTPLVSPTETATLVLPSATETATATATVSTPEPSATPTAQIITAVTLDNLDASIVYSENWTDVADDQAFQGSFKKSGPLGSTASFSFTGSSFSLFYTTNSTFGDVEVKVDGVVVGVIDQNSATRQLNQKWDNPVVLVPGLHTVTLTHTGPVDTRITLDAVTIYP